MRGQGLLKWDPSLEIQSALTPGRLKARLLCGPGKCSNEGSHLGFAGLSSLQGRAVQIQLCSFKGKLSCTPRLEFESIPRAALGLSAVCLGTPGSQTRRILYWICHHELSRGSPQPETAVVEQIQVALPALVFLGWWSRFTPCSGFRCCSLLVGGK